MHFLGNHSILKSPKTAFLCSRKCPAEIILKSYDWAIAEREKGSCIISGFHSKIEKDVFHFLLKGNQPVILVLARGLKKRLEPELKEPVQSGRLLIVSPFEETLTRVTAETALHRNRVMAQLADKILIAYAQKGGALEKLIPEFTAMGKPISTFGYFPGSLFSPR